MGLKYLDWVTSVKNCLEKFVEKKTESEGTEEKKDGDVVVGEGGTIDLTKVDNAHVALRLEIERCIRVSKKMKDDAVLEMKDITFDKTLLGILPKNLVSESIAAQILLDEQCQKRKNCRLVFSLVVLVHAICLVAFRWVCVGHLGS